MNTTEQISDQRQRRLELARKAFKEFYAQCFWSADPNHHVVESDLPWIIRNSSPTRVVSIIAAVLNLHRKNPALAATLLEDCGVWVQVH